jgi:hypothetical protein
MIEMKQQTKSNNNNKQVNKKVYRCPVLVEYGTVSKLTQGMGGTMNDGASGMNMA